MGLNIWPPQIAANIARGIVYTAALGTSAHVGDTETVLYSHTFKAAAGRTYKIHYRFTSVDTDGTGDSTEPARYAKNSALIYCRWKSGTSVAVTDPQIAQGYQSVYDDDSTSSSGTELTAYLINPPAGDVTVGISVKTGRAAATYGQVRFLPGGGARMVVEDVGSVLA
ncbi:hypothetical protein SEA_GOBY_23 [Streptomyces phage Goby]|uniref:DUF7298 domain-containing protein n=1 Tax=Streptomyces phage Goby TaxID=2182319 RepID=A0A2U8UTS7_9CAUD|nr:hypothetical protein KGH00_gp23 [Streptomyces phage Goby]ATE85128.1 hypothetical protein SEA_DATTRAN_24 [Streptomyces phage Dattran]AWN07542.1 hypothetical protein SEA_GOBY_23 [Streptomyces phage Goby]AWN07618.1 hypothetical protein SEA_TOMA_23 [Streptomyces phage Toma]